MSHLLSPGQFIAFFMTSLVVSLITWLFMVVVGRRIIRHSRFVALLAGATFSSFLIAATAVLTIPNTPEGLPPDTLPGPLFVSLIILLVFSFPFSLVATTIYIIRYRSKNVR